MWLGLNSFLKFADKNLVVCFLIIKELILYGTDLVEMKCSKPYKIHGLCQSLFFTKKICWHDIQILTICIYSHTILCMAEQSTEKDLSKQYDQDPWTCCRIDA